MNRAAQRCVALSASIVLALSSSACTAPRILPSEDFENRDRLVERIHPGDIVYVTEDGDRSRIKVDSIDAKSIRGEGKEFDLAHVTKIETLQLDPVRTGWAVVGIALIIGAVVSVLTTPLTNPP